MSGGAVERAVREHGPALLAYFARRVTPVEDAADLMSEVMLVAWRRRADLPAAPDDRPWLFGVARHVLANHRRGRLREANTVDRAVAHLRTGITRTAPAGPEGLDLARALDSLPEEDRELITLSAWEGLSSTEIATVLGLPASTVRGRLVRVRETLRDLLQVRL